MNQASLRWLVCCAAIGYLFIGDAAGQVYTESRTSAGGQTRSSRSYYMPGMFKFVEDDGSMAIMRFDRDYWVSVDDKRKEYWQMTFAELEAKMKGMGAQMDEAMQQMPKELESMPAEQRRQMEQMMGSQFGTMGSAGQLAVKKGSQSRTIGGLSCTRYAVTENGKEILILWTTREVPEFTAMRRDYEKFAKSMAAMRRSSGAAAQTRAWSEAMRVIDGFPMETESAGSKSTVTKLERRSTPAREFEPPAGYKKVQPPF